MSFTIRPHDRFVAASVLRVIVELARDASIEINVPEIKHLASARSILGSGRKMYVSHLPKQSWAETIAATQAIRDAGFDPVPHVPVRLLANGEEADEIIGALSAYAHEVLLISGDYGEPRGPFSSVIELLRTGVLVRHGVSRLSFAGHPEGHPRVALEKIRDAEIEKDRWARESGVAATILTQFFFESAPFTEWVDELRTAGTQSRIVAGVAGPASIAKLVRFAVRCGVGRSLRALGAGPNVMTRLLDEHGPETLLAELARSRMDSPTAFDGIHLFGFGGFVRTCEWLRRMTNGEFVLAE